MTIDAVAENQGQLGSLKPFGKCRKEFICRECKEEFPIGSPGYNQSDYRCEGFFPEQTKVCMKCGSTNLKTADVQHSSTLAVGTALGEMICEDCGYAGICPEVENVDDFKKNLK